MRFLAKSLIFNLLMVSGIFLSSPTMAQQAQSSSSGGGANPNPVGTILVSSLVGGLLGLSTLSFYKEPEEHIKNIPIGAAIGAVAAALFVSYEVATGPVSETKTPSFMIAPDLEKQEMTVVLSKSF